MLFILVTTISCSNASLRQSCRSSARIFKFPIIDRPTLPPPPAVVVFIPSSSHTSSRKQPKSGAAGCSRFVVFYIDLHLYTQNFITHSQCVVVLEIYFPEKHILHCWANGCVVRAGSSSIADQAIQGSCKLLVRRSTNETPITFCKHSIRALHCTRTKVEHFRSMEKSAKKWEVARSECQKIGVL